MGPRNRQPDMANLRFPKRSFWKDRTRRLWSFYCPLCHVARRIPYQPRPGIKHLIQIGLTATFLTLLTWNWFEWKGIVAFVPLWGVFEVLYRSRVRGALACVQCGFDPYLYLVDVSRAREVVENHWRKKFAEKGIPYPEKNAPPKSAATPAVPVGKASSTESSAKASSAEMVT